MVSAAEVRRPPSLTRKLAGYRPLSGHHPCLLNNTMSASRLRRSYCLFLIALPAVFLCGTTTGCNDSMSRVSGTVTLDGKLLDSGRVVFHKDGQAPAIANIDSHGTYSLAIGATESIQPGDYVVTVASYQVGKPAADGNPPPVRLITPQRYVDTQTTDLQAKVEGGTNEIDFALSSRGSS